MKIFNKKYILVLLILYNIFSNTIYCQYGFDTVEIFFDIGKFDIKTDDKLKLKQFAKEWNSNNQKILIYGYADYLGTQVPNFSLAENRADVVKNFLLASGLSKNNILQVDGLGQRNDRGHDVHGNRNFRKAFILVKRVIPHNIIHSNKNKVVPTKIIEKVVYLKKQDSHPLTSSQIFQALKNLTKEQSLIIPTIYFKYNSSELSIESYHELDTLYKVLVENQSWKLLFEGHICCLMTLDSDAYDDFVNNNYLSLNRANSVRKYLINKGINASRLYTKGWGASKKLIIPEFDDTAKSLNRRVEIKLINK